LLSREAWDGYKFEVIYEADRATRIQDSLGQKLTLHWSEAGKLTQVRDPAGTSASYEHDGAGNLLKFTDTTGRLIQYAYDDQRNLTQRSHPDDRHQQVSILPAHHGWSPLSCLWRDPSESLRVDDTR
jgi:YD repeat-containing protein